MAVFDPEPLKEIAQELFDQLPDVSAGRFDVIGQTLTAVDGSVVETLARVARLSWLPKAKGASLCGYRLHTQFEVLRGIPSRIDVTPAKPKGEDDERAVLARTVEPDRMYMMDRGYAQFALWNAIVAKGSSSCCRIRDNSSYDVQRAMDLTDADRAAGVVGDEVVLFGRSKGSLGPDHHVRIVTVKATPHSSRGKRGGGSTGPNCDGSLRIATNRLDLPAELIGEIYRLPVDHAVHRPQAHQADLRDGLLLPLGLGKRGRNGAASRGTPQAGVILLRAGRCRSVRCCAADATLADLASRS